MVDNEVTKAYLKEMKGVLADFEIEITDTITKELNRKSSQVACENYIHELIKKKLHSY